MKKSFLKRAMAAAAAVPFALTQTAMFTTFAAEESNSKVVTISTFLDVEGNLETNAPATGEFKAPEAQEKYAIVQENDWNGDLRAALSSMLDDKVSLDPAKFADSISSTAWYSDLVKVALKSEGSAVEVAIKNDEVVVTIKLNSNCGQYIADHATAGLGAEYQAAVKNLKSDAVIKGEIVFTADTSDLDLEKRIPVTATANIEGLKSGKFDETVIPYAKNVLAEAEKAAKAAVAAKGLDASKLDSAFNRYENRLNTAQRAADKAGESYSKEFTAADGADLWKQARNYAVEQSPRFERIPEELSAAKESNAYAAAADIFAQAIAKLNEKAATKSGAYTVQTDLDAIVNVFEGATNITASFGADSYSYAGEAWGYIADEDYDESNYKTYFEELVAKDNLEVVEIKNVKVFEIAADATEVTDGAEGSAYLNVYRVVYPVTKPIEITPEGRTDVQITLKDRFCFSHDPRYFDDMNLIESAVVLTTNAEGKVTETRYMTDDELKKISLSFHKEATWEEAEPSGEKVSPQSAFADETLKSFGAYVDNTIYAYYEGVLVKNATGQIAIGVKGDANLDGVANATDAAKVLIYAADFGAGKKPSIFSTENEKLENFAYFLADTTGESEDHGATLVSVSDDGAITADSGENKSPLNATDAAQILQYAANFGANGKCNWIPEVIKGAPYPSYSYEIAAATDLLQAK